MGGWVLKGSLKEALKGAKGASTARTAKRVQRKKYMLQYYL